MSVFGGAHAKPVLGVAYLVVIALLVGASVLTYRKDMPWQRSADVTLTTTTPGLELNPLSDVKLQGVRVGEVRRITSDGRAATIELAVDPDQVDLIPANVDAAIVPKTLFGEKYVDLRIPDSPSKDRIADGDVIRQSTTSVEIGALFSKLVPVLEALEPDKVSVVLTSLAHALNGRGHTLAAVLRQLDDFLGKVDPHLTTVTHDLRQLATTTDVYADSAPELLQVLSASAGISRELLVPKEQQLADLLHQVTEAASTTAAVLRTNAQRLISLFGRARPVLAVLNEYADNLPCILKGLHLLDTLGNQSVGARGPFVNLAVDLIAQQKPYTYPDDLPGNPRSDASVGNLPSTVPSFAPHCPQFAPYVYRLEDAKPYSQPLTGTPLVPGDDAGERSAPLDAAVQEATEGLARAVAAQLLGVPQKNVPGYAELLLAPMLSDGKVDVP